MPCGRDMPSILVLGDINLDVLMHVPAYPAPGGEAVTERIITRLGGSAANTAVVLSRLGLEVRLLSRVGNDPWGQLALDALAQAGVGLDLVQRDPAAATGLMFTVVTPDGERTMFGQRGANPLTDPAAITPDTLRGADLLHLSGYALLEIPQREAAVRAMELAHQRGLLVVLDTAYLPALKIPHVFRQYLPALDACILGLQEAQALLGAGEPEAAVSALLEAGVRLAALKLGAGGCLLAEGAATHLSPAFPVDVVDTTGAGDAFSAGLIYARLHGLSLSALGTLANTLGGLATTVHGAGTALPGKVELLHYLRLRQASETPERRRAIADALQSLS
jgi:ribokinase